MQITYTQKSNKQAVQGEFDPSTKVLRLAGGSELHLSDEDDLKLAKKLIYSQIVTMPEMKVTTLNSLCKL